MSDEQLHKLSDAFSTLGGMIGLGLVGILLLLVLLIAWRRHLARRREVEARRAARADATDAADLWQAGGKRLTNLVAPLPAELDEPPDDSIAGEDNEEEDDDDDDDDEKEWWQKG